MAERITPEDALVEAVRIIGSQAAMGRLCDVKQPTVWKWLDKRAVLPAEHVLKVEGATGISKHDLRPDIYPRDAAVLASGAAPSGGVGGSPSNPGAAQSPDPLPGFAA